MIRLFIAGIPFVGLGEIIHREMHAAEIAARHSEIARLLGAGGEHQHAIIVHQPLDRDVDSDLHIGAEDHALALHLAGAAGAVRECPVRVSG